MKNYENIATLHGLKMAKERCGYKNPDSAEKMMRLATVRGKKAEDFSSRERDYLKSREHGCCFAVAYNGYCFILNEPADKCITVYRLPVWFGKKKHYDGKKRIRDCKKYFNSYRFIKCAV